MRLLTACLLCALALPAAAQIYKYTDAKGNTVFTNQPPEGQDVESVALPPTNTVEAQKPAAVAEQPQPDANTPPYSVLQLSNIPTEEALRANNGTFTVNVKMEPRLITGHRLRLLLDGQPYGQASNVTRLQVVNADRGEHSLAVEVLSGDKQIQQSAAITFTVQRVNTKSPALRPPPKPAP